MNKLSISFSGGETSAYMTWWLLNKFKGQKEMVVIFANTGEENEQTLEFVNKCDRLLNFNTVWVEAITNPIDGKGIKAKIVNYETASRNGEPFEAMIKKHGIPNISEKHCSRELKQYAIKAYLRNIGWRKDYKTAIGIRADEIDRISENAVKENLWYPLVGAGITKSNINTFWKNQSFRLELKGYEGNCNVCWKKSLRKLLTIAKEHPERFDNFKLWEQKYENYVPLTKQHNKNIKLPKRFFRQNLSVDNILELSKKPFTPASDDSIIYADFQLKLFNYDLDISNGCIESCEVF
jgi:hypothetical protein